MGSGEEWVDRLPAELAAQKALLSGLLEWCRCTPLARFFMVGCSLARGNADWMSDVDVGIGVDDDALDQAVALLKDEMAHLGPLVECFDHRIAGVASPHRRIFAQYADRSQVDLVVQPASQARFSPGTVLYDPEGRAGPVTAGGFQAGPEDVARWAALAWAALADVGKYGRRGSAWEAHGRVEEARAHFWRLLAVAEGVAEPEYGITSLLDAQPRPRLPGQVAATVAGPDLQEVIAAATALGRLLEEVQGRLRAQGDYVFPSALAAFVLSDLEALLSGGAA
jgi:hypothetical protein